MNWLKICYSEQMVIFGHASLRHKAVGGFDVAAIYEHA
jgi:hypothetical protein